MSNIVTTSELVQETAIAHGLDKAKALRLRVMSESKGRVSRESRR